MAGRWAFWVAMPVIGAPARPRPRAASGWRPTRSAALGLLILARSALGRVLAILGLIGVTTVLGYMAISVPAERRGGGNLTFMLIMIALTLVAVVVAVLHPIAWTDEEMRFAVGAPAALGIARRSSWRSPLGELDAARRRAARGHAARRWRSASALGVAASSPGCSRSAGRLGFGPLAPPPAAGRPDRLPRAARRPARRLAAAGLALGLPVVWMAVCLVALPLAVYVVSYIPWALSRTTARRRLAAGPHRPDAARADRSRCTTITTA